MTGYTFLFFIKDKDMGKISTVKYLSDLRTEAVHLESGDRIYTDAPKENEGKGEVFSPTDLVATSLASCMITVKGIKARQYNIDMNGATADFVKKMDANPRQISVI
jgi:putative redox protein